MPKAHPAGAKPRLIVVAAVLTMAATLLPMSIVAAADTVAPVVGTPILSPTTANGGEAVMVTTTATDAVAVASAEVRVDGGPWTAMGGAFGGSNVGLTGSVGTAGVSAIAIGPLHGCALLGDANLRCWGWNYFGQVGDGTSGVASMERRSAVGVPNLSGVTAVGLGDHHTCALLADTTVRCWGHNFAGQLGDGTTTDRLAPAPVAGLVDVTALAVGMYHDCALLLDTTVKCWGWNSAGELGDGSTTNRHAPVAVVGLSGVTAVAAGFGFTCALLDDTTVRCWGLNQSGQVGAGTTATMYLTPVAVPGLTGVTAISAGSDHVCALRVDTTVRCWGSNALGQIGDGTTTDQLSPVEVTGLTGVTAVVAANGGYHSCALLTDASVRCWGSDASGALGDGSPTATRTEPVLVAGLSGVTAIGAGREYSCALGPDVAVRCWGFNGFGRLGDGTGLDRLSPSPVADLAGFLASGPHEVCVRATDDSGNTSDGTACAALAIRYGHTPVGSLIGVRFGDSTGGPSSVSATFDEVTSAGESTVITSTTGPATPDSLVFGDPVAYHTLSTTAAVTNATVCIDSALVAYPDGSELRLYQFVGGEWIEVTTVRVLPGSTICGRVASLGLFVVVQFRYGDTPAGESVEVTFADSSGAASPVSATFADVTLAGVSTASVSSAGPTPPATFQLGDPAVYYELSTTATFASATVCISFAGISYTDPTSLRLLHYEGGTWVDVTSSLDPWGGSICGVVDSFSPFVVAQLANTFSGFYAPVDAPPVRNVAKAGSAIPIKFSVGGYGGSAVFAAGFPQSVETTCDTQTPLDAVEETVPASHSGLSFDTRTGRYTYVWATNTSWAGTCRQLVVRLADGTEHRADFSFRQ